MLERVWTLWWLAGAVLIGVAVPLAVVMVAVDHRRHRHWPSTALAAVWCVLAAGGNWRASRQPVATAIRYSAGAALCLRLGAGQGAGNGRRDRFLPEHAGCHSSLSAAAARSTGGLWSRGRSHWWRWYCGAHCDRPPQRGHRRLDRSAIVAVQQALPLLSVVR